MRVVCYLYIMSNNKFPWGEVRLERRADNFAVLTVPNVKVTMEAEHSILSFHDFSRESFTFNFTLIIYTRVRGPSAYRLLPSTPLPPLIIICPLYSTYLSISLFVF